MPRGHHLTAEQRECILVLRDAGWTQQRVAAVLGLSKATISNISPGYVGRVPVAPLREAFLCSPVTAADVARDVGWWERGKADTSRVKRTLGLLDDSNHGHRFRRTMVDAETVELLAEAIGVAAWSVMPDDRPAADLLAALKEIGT